MKKKLAISLIFILFILYTPFHCMAGSGIEITPQKQLEFINYLMENGKYDQALNELERYIYFFPGKENILYLKYLMGLCYLEKKEYERARQIFSKIMERDSTGRLGAKAFLLMGESYYRQGVFKEAEKYFRRLASQGTYPDLKEAAQYRIGWVLLMLNQWNEASQVFKDISPGSSYYPSAEELSNKSLMGLGLPEKNPNYAGVLAGVLPGLGHAYVGRYKDGLVAFILNGVFIWATIEAFHEDQEVLGGILGFLELGWYTGNIYSAVNCSHKYNRKVRNDFRKGLHDAFDLNIFKSPNGHTGLILTWHF